MDELITVIIPVYNVEKYLEKCVGSVISQTYADLEIILVDDGSTDSSPHICDKLACTDKRIRVIHQKNGGLSMARNVGLENAKGIYIGFVDSDDWIDADMYECMLRSLRQNEADIAVCGVYKVDTDSFSIMETPEEGFAADNASAMKLLIDNDMLQSHAWNKLYKRGLWEGIRFPEGKVYEDIFCIHEIFQKAGRIAFINQPMYYYLQRGDSIVNSRKISNTLDGYEAYRKRLGFVEAEYPGLTDAAQRSLALSGLALLRLLSARPYSERKAYSQQVKEIAAFIRKNNIEHTRGKRDRLELAIVKLSIRLFYTWTWVFTRAKPLIEKHKGGCLQRYRARKNRLPFRPPYMEGKPLAVMFGTPEYNNLGDHAIAYATYAFIAQHCPDRQIVPVPERQVNAAVPWLKKNLGDKDIIVLQGGGNMGNVYMDQEYIRRLAMRSFHANHIFVFPQTIHYTKDAGGQRALRKSMRIYGKHPNLTLVAREKKSFELMKGYYPNNSVLLSPDIVMSLNKTADTQREGVLLCIRSDRESILSPDDITRIKQICLAKYKRVQMTETCLQHNIPEGKRTAELENKWAQFSRAALIITDRLHGVIFAAITSTPCIAFDNYNNKVRNICRWFAAGTPVVFCDGVDGFLAAIGDTAGNGFVYDETVFAEQFRALSDAINTVGERT